MRMPLPPPPADGLISSGKPTSRARADEALRIVVLDRRRRDRKAVLGDEGARADLVAHQLDRIGVGPTKAIPAASTTPGEVGILGQEAVAWMDGVGAGGCGRGDDLRARRDRRPPACGP